MIKPGLRRLSIRASGLWLAALLMVRPPFSLSSPQADPPDNQPVPGQSRVREGERIGYRLDEYAIKARVPIIGEIGYVGTFAIEGEVRRNGDFLDNFLRIFGASKPELARDRRDYSGEMEVLRRVPAKREDGGDGREITESGAAVGRSSGFFKKNGVIQSENIVFFSDYALSRRENGQETRVEGSHDGLISALRYFLEHDVKEGDVYKSTFIFGAHPYIFRCEVGRPTVIQPQGAKAFPIDLMTFDMLQRDGTGKYKAVKKKGSIRLYLCQDEPYKNIYLRLKIEYKWFLTLQMEWIKGTDSAPVDNPAAFR
jgi:hypothetical protein